MNGENISISNTKSLLENLTRTVLYEGYSIFPYHRSSIKNQKPIPFGVIYPEEYQTHNLQVPSVMQTECIITAQENTTINITVRFLHLITSDAHQENDKNYINTYQGGWQTIEREVNSGNLLITTLVNSQKILPIKFNEIDIDKKGYDNNENLKAKIFNNVSPIEGKVIIKAFAIANEKNIFRLRITVINNTAVINADDISRDEAFRQSFLSTNTILKINDGEFISDQSPAENFRDIVAKCQKIGTWPILIDESNTTMLSSPIILYDYPQINAQSKGDLFDSLEIEEMLILHLSAMSDEEKERIGESDEKMRAMLDKARQVTPEELLNLHGGMFENKQFKI